ncbi:L,D-transpeptidase family protein [Candidatus Uhrbacteria bacterium]|nr:L,D-transpeptidase family protein [Candidatus Uhrbacteria bacterium]
MRVVAGVAVAVLRRPLGKARHEVVGGIAVLVMSAAMFPVAAQAVTGLPDADADGIPDTWEELFATSPHLRDTDGDGYADGEELRRGQDPTQRSPAMLTQVQRQRDTDGDGIADVQEFIWELSPFDVDSDGDGYPDGVEIAHAHDPRNRSSIPLVKRIEVNRRTQQLTYAVGTYVMGTVQVSTGKPRTPTPTGTFRVAAKSPRAWSSLAHLWMPWWMNFTGPGISPGRFGIHELPEWPNGRKEGEGHLGRPVSGGCVRVGRVEAKKLYDWADIGTEIVIR